MVRNIYDILFSFYNHLIENVDSSIGRSTDNYNFLKSLPYEESLTLLITGYFIPSTGERFRGIRCEFERMKSYFDYIKNGGNAIIIDFDSLVGSEKKKTILEIIKFLEIDSVTNETIERLISKKNEVNNLTKASHKNNIHKMHLKESISEFHISLIENIFDEVFENYDLNFFYNKFNLRPLVLKPIVSNNSPLNIDKVSKNTFIKKITEKLKKTYKILDFIHE